jgi:neutral ceramidase
MNTAFEAGAAVRNITPTPELVNTTLHHAMTVRADECGSPLKAKALALSFGGKSQVLVTLDLPHIRDSAAQLIRGVAASATGLAVDDVVLSCSHTHSAPFLDPVDKPHPFLDFVAGQTADAAREAMQSQRPARFGHGVTHVAGASFNTRVPLPNGGVKFARDFREGLASGRPIDPRLNVVRIDDENGRPIAGWVRFATHPANVIIDGPISAEYPGYMTDRLSETVDGSPPFLFGYGAAGDVNCIPMFGREDQSRDLGLRLADLLAETFCSIQTSCPRRVLARHAAVELPLVEPPSVETLDREIKEVESFIDALKDDPKLIWVLGFNCGDQWPVEMKQKSAKPLADWAQAVKKMLAAGHRFPTTWTRHVTAWIIDDLGLVFDPGETFVEIGLAVSARSPLQETLVLTLCNGLDHYLATDADRRRGGYEPFLSARYFDVRSGETRPLPYRLGAADRYVDQIVQVFADLDA